MPQRAIIKKCSFVGCSNNSKEKKNFKLFNFRKHDYRQWMTVCDEKLEKLTEMTILSHYYVCENHFKRTHFHMYLSPHRRLTKDAFPVQDGEADSTWETPISFREDVMEKVLSFGKATDPAAPSKPKDTIKQEPISSPLINIGEIVFSEMPEGYKSSNNNKARGVSSSRLSKKSSIANPDVKPPIFGVAIAPSSTPLMLGNTLHSMYPPPDPAPKIPTSSFVVTSFSTDSTSCSTEITSSANTSSSSVDTSSSSTDTSSSSADTSSSSTDTTSSTSTVSSTPSIDACGTTPSLFVISSVASKAITRPANRSLTGSYLRHIAPRPSTPRNETQQTYKVLSLPPNIFVPPSLNESTVAGKKVETIDDNIPKNNDGVEDENEVYIKEEMFSYDSPSSILEEICSSSSNLSNSLPISNTFPNSTTSSDTNTSSPDSPVLLKSEHCAPSFSPTTSNSIKCTSPIVFPSAASSDIFISLSNKPSVSIIPDVNNMKAKAVPAPKTTTVPNGNFSLQCRLSDHNERCPCDEMEELNKNILRRIIKEKKRKVISCRHRPQRKKRELSERIHPPFMKPTFTYNPNRFPVDQFCNKYSNVLGPYVTELIRMHLLKKKRKQMKYTTSQLWFSDKVMNGVEKYGYNFLLQILPFPSIKTIQREMNRRREDLNSETELLGFDELMSDFSGNEMDDYSGKEMNDYSGKEIDDYESDWVDVIERKSSAINDKVSFEEYSGNYVKIDPVTGLVSVGISGETQ